MSESRRRLQNVVLFIADFICIMVSFYLSGYLWLVIEKDMEISLYMNEMKEALVYIVLSLIIASVFFDFNEMFTRRGKIKELSATIKKGIVIGASITILDFLLRSYTELSRVVFVLTIIFYTIICFIVRTIIKSFLMSIMKARFATPRMMLIVTKDRAEKVINSSKHEKNWLSQLTSIVIVDDDMVGQSINGIPVVANRETMINYFKNEIVDEVFIDYRSEDKIDYRQLMLKLEDMGITVHLSLDIVEQFSDFAATYEYIGNIPVVTFANRFYDYKQLAIKRIIDIIGALVGLAIMFVLLIFVGPAIKIESKGPIFFKQKRVGKNGRYFYIYKFRSMYIDAEERKKELMAKNEMSGLMFKMKDDPRITKVGKFIRKTSIDELPQFFNVLKGDMSLVGTRPPTVAEFKQYEGHHKRRLSMKPGITGMWQAYGRNSVMDFEEIVKMDLDYIDNWSLGKDFKILMKTVVTVFSNSGQ